MKPIKLFLLMFLILFSSSVKAECTTKEINNLKKEADKITITYKHLDGIETDNGISEKHLFALNPTLSNTFHKKEYFIKLH